MLCRNSMLVIGEFMKKTILCVTIIFVVALGIIGGRREYRKHDAGGMVSKVTVDSKTGYVFKYNFIKNPKIGQSRLKISVTRSAAKAIPQERLPQQINNLDIKVHYGLPQTKEYHTTVNSVPRSNFGGYLLQVNLPVPGTWQFDLYYHDRGREIFHDTLEVEI